MSVLFTDAFTRADSADLGTNWTVETGLATFAVASNAAAPSDINSDCGEYVNSVTPANDHYAQIKVTITNSHVDNNFNGYGVAIRMATGAITWYGAVCKDGRVTLIEATAGSFAALANNATTSWTDGQVLYLEAQSTSLLVKINGSNWAPGATTDATIASGRFGVISGSGGSYTVGTGDDFEGGDFAAAGDAVPQAWAQYRTRRL